MTLEELLDKKNFIELFKKNEFERIEFENYLYEQAVKLGEVKRFEKTLRKYEKAFSEKIPLDQKLTHLPKSKYDIENYDFGKYVCTMAGIIDTKTDYKFSYLPILPVERYINEDTNKEKVKIIYFKENEWKEMIVDRSQLSVNYKLLSLSDFGLDITSENVRYYINYFNEIMNMNDIKKLKSVSHIGWKDDKFIPYESHGIFDGADEFRNIYKAISSKGNYEKWLETTKELRKNKVIRILMAVTFASPLLEKLGIQPFIANLWSSLSGSGKTLSCMVAMSAWGNPDIGALRLSSNNTQNYYMTVASFMRNITCYFDELQIIKNSKVIDLESLVMDLCNGTDKGRLNKNSQAKEVRVWNNNFLFTSNDRLVKENAGEQVYNRVIDIEANNIIIENGVEIARIIKGNYGFAGREYIKYIQKVGFEVIFKRYKEIYNDVLDKTKATSKQASAFASILLADELANKCIFNDADSLEIDDVKEYINDKDEIKTAIKAKDYIISTINANWKRFDDNNYGECWGIKDQYFCTMNAGILFRELGRGGFDFNSIKKDWSEMGFLEKSGTGRFIHQTSVRNQKGSYVRLKLT